MDRAQPGAIETVARNYELGDVLGQFSEGWIVPADDPTISARRSTDLDQSAFEAFDLTHSATSLTVTVQPGEAFVSGWLARDEPTDIELDADAETTVVLGWDPDAIYDPESDATRDDADRVLVDIDANVADDVPQTAIWTVETDADGVVSVADERRIGPSADIESLTDAAGNVIEDFAGNALAVEDGRLNSEPAVDTRRAINQLFVQTGRHDFELGLARLEYADGQFEVYADDERIAADEDVNLVLGLPSDDEGYVELAEGATEGSTTHAEQDMGFLPDEAVVVDELFSELPDGADVRYEIEDENGNVVTAGRDDLDSVVDLDAIETFRVTTTAILDRETDTDPTPQVDAWSAYLDGQEPSGAYMDATITDERDAEV